MTVLSRTHHAVLKYFITFRFKTCADDLYTSSVIQCYTTDFFLKYVKNYSDKKNSTF